MTLLKIIILASIQGAAELLPVSSSAHVILAQKLMGLDPASPEMTFLIVMLHTGTMFAVLLYFWPRWKKLLAPGARAHFVRMIAVATVLTGVLGFGLKILIEKVILEKLLGESHAEVEQLFRNLPLMGTALLGVGVLILLAGRVEGKAVKSEVSRDHAVAIGLVQGLCLPFRGFSRSGATISTALFCGISRSLAEDFSFALALVLTPPVILMELRRLLKAQAAQGASGLGNLGSLLTPGAIGMVFSFIAGLLALKLLSNLLEAGKWRYFGYYCLAASIVVFASAFAGL